MKINTKFDLRDRIYFISPLSIGKVKVLSNIVRGIKIEVKEGETNIIYLCTEEEDARVYLKVEADNAFSTKEELLASL